MTATPIHWLHDRCTVVGVRARWAGGDSYGAFVFFWDSGCWARRGSCQEEAAGFEVGVVGEGVSFASQDLEQVVGSVDAAAAGPTGAVRAQDLLMPGEGCVDGVGDGSGSSDPDEGTDFSWGVLVVKRSAAVSGCGAGFASPAETVTLTAGGFVASSTVSCEGRAASGGGATLSDPTIADAAADADGRVEVSLGDGRTVTLASPGRRRLARSLDMVVLALPMWMYADSVFAHVQSSFADIWDGSLGASSGVSRFCSGRFAAR